MIANIPHILANVLSYYTNDISVIRMFTYRVFPGTNANGERMAEFAIQYLRRVFLASRFRGLYSRGMERLNALTLHPDTRMRYMKGLAEHHYDKVKTYSYCDNVDPYLFPNLRHVIINDYIESCVIPDGVTHVTYGHRIPIGALPRSVTHLELTGWHIVNGLEYDPAEGFCIRNPFPSHVKYLTIDSSTEFITWEEIENFTWHHMKGPIGPNTLLRSNPSTDGIEKCMIVGTMPRGLKAGCDIQYGTVVEVKRTKVDGTFLPKISRRGNVVTVDFSRVESRSIYSIEISGLRSLNLLMPADVSGLENLDITNCRLKYFKCSGELPLLKRLIVSFYSIYEKIMKYSKMPALTYLDAGDLPKFGSVTISGECIARLDHGCDCCCEVKVECPALTCYYKDRSCDACDYNDDVSF